MVQRQFIGFEPHYGLWISFIVVEIFGLRPWLLRRCGFVYTRVATIGLFTQVAEIIANLIMIDCTTLDSEDLSTGRLCVVGRVCFFSQIISTCTAIRRLSG